LLTLWLFAYSVALYSCLRLVDVWSTKLALSELSFEMHEVNTPLVALAKKYGFNRAAILLSFIAIPIGLVDVLVIYPLVGFPIFWLYVGLFHVLAAANNVQMYFQAKIMGKESVERYTRQLVRDLKGLSAIERILYLIKMNFFFVALAIYGFFALGLFSVLLSSLEISLLRPTSYLILLGPPIMILDLISFFAVIVFGSLILARRQLKLAGDREWPLERNDRKVSIPVDILKTAINEAERTGVEYVELHIPDSI